MNKKYGLLLLAFLASTACAQTLYLPQNITVTVENIKTATVRVIYDVHDVLAQAKSRTGIAIASAPNAALEGINLGFSKVFGGIFGKSSTHKAYRECTKVPKGYHGEAYAIIFKKHKKNTLARMMEKISDSYRPMPGMDTLIKDLHARGYQQFIASNIGAHSFLRLKQKFAKNKYNCSMFNTLKIGKVVDYSRFGAQPGVLPVSITVTEVTQHPKPSPQFFADFNKSHNITINDITVFIDDKVENIQKAVQDGWIGIVFKSATQVRNDLKTLGLL